ncbi:nuclease-related domain-containing protein [Pseudidiomarina salilacus]|uniref:nuclease-related domain-containing protein n=1 Tax=Pseudidiomarina salilacus TaxID=3384452 RepID=UPI003984D8F2
MDVTTQLFDAVQAMMLQWGAYFIVFAIIVGFFRTNWFKGKLGEALVNLAAKLRLDKNTYHLIKDVTLPSGDGTTQIDHIIVSVYGVFVVETKYYRGWIFGSAKQKNWTQSVYRRKYSFQNPLLQNYKHVQTLKELLGLDEHQVHSVVVFIGDSQFKTQMPANVAYGGAYVNYIRSFTTPVLDVEQVEMIKQHIQSNALARSLKTDRQHRDHLRDKFASTSTAAAVTKTAEMTNTCGKCGADMKLRTATRGANKGQQFWGCSGYPKCRNVMPYNAN